MRLTVMVLLLLESAPWALSQVVEPRPLRSDLPVYLPAGDSSGTSEARAIENPTGPISLRDALALALLQNPELAAFAWELRAREARILQAGRPPNPAVTAVVQDIGGNTGLTGASDPIQTQATIELSQVIELGGKRAARKELATANRDRAAWDYEAARIDVLSRVTRAYLDVLASQETVTLTEKTNGIVEEVKEAVLLRVSAGVVSRIEQTKADVALAAVKMESDRARRRLEADRRKLAALWGGDSARFDSVTGDLTELPPVPSFGELQAGLTRNPELARWAAEIAQREAALAVERAKRVPDVAVIGGYRRYIDIDDDAFTIGASIQVPLFDRNQGAIQEARERIGKAHEERRAAEARVTTMLAEAHRALASARDDVCALSVSVVPGSRSAFEAVEEGYRLGKFSYLEVLDAQRTLVSASGQYLRALAEYHKAAADVEQLIGAPLGEITSSNAESSTDTRN